MIRIRIWGLVIASVLFAAVLIAAFATEGIGLAAIVAIGGAVLAAMIIPVVVMFEEELGLPAERAHRRYPR